MTADGMLAETQVLAAMDGGELPTYIARPLGPGPFPSIVMLHHRDGWDDGSKEIARRLAAHGVVCVLPHLHHRYAPDEPHDVAAAAALALGGASDEHVVSDARAGLEHARRQPYANGRVGVLGFCSGGRQAFLAACGLPFNAAIVCYGTRITPRMHEPTAASPTAPLDQAVHLRAPLLGLFGEEDHVATSEDATAIAAELRRLGVDHRVVTYEAAGHAFFATDRETYAVAAAKQGWVEILDWIDTHLTASPAEHVGPARS